nr:uncharacterized protein LOC127332359 isoform X2 [Lolium perenne]
MGSTCILVWSITSCRWSVADWWSAIEIQQRWSAIEGCLAGAGDEHGGGEQQQFVSGRSLEQLERSYACWRSRRSGRPGQRGRGSRSSSQVLLGSEEEDRAELHVLGILATWGSRGPRDEGIDNLGRSSAQVRRPGGATWGGGSTKGKGDRGRLGARAEGGGQRAIVEAEGDRRRAEGEGGRRSTKGEGGGGGRSTEGEIWEGTGSKSGKGNAVFFPVFTWSEIFSQRLTFLDGGSKSHRMPCSLEKYTWLGQLHIELSK